MSSSTYPAYIGSPSARADSRNRRASSTVHTGIFFDRGGDVFAHVEHSDAAASTAPDFAALLALQPVDDGTVGGAGMACPFSLTGTAVPEGLDTIRINYNGTTCLGPVSGSEVLKKR